MPVTATATSHTCPGRPQLVSGTFPGLARQFCTSAGQASRRAHLDDPERGRLQLDWQVGTLHPAVVRLSARMRSPVDLLRPLAPTLPPALHGHWPRREWCIPRGQTGVLRSRSRPLVNLGFMAIADRVLGCTWRWPLDQRLKQIPLSSVPLLKPFSAPANCLHPEISQNSVGHS